MGDKDVRGLDIEVDDARVVNKAQTLNGERWENPKSQVSLMGSRHKHRIRLAPAVN